MTTVPVTPSANVELLAAQASPNRWVAITTELAAIRVKYDSGLSSELTSVVGEVLLPGDRLVLTDKQAVNAIYARSINSNARVTVLTETNA